MAIALSPSTFAARRYCRIALAVSIACMPLYVVRYRVGPLPTTLLESVILVTIAMYVVSVVQAGTWRLRRTPIEIPAAVFMVAAVIGIGVSFDHVGALGQFRAFFLEPIVIFYIALDMLEGTRDFRLVAAAFLAGETFLDPAVALAAGLALYSDSANDRRWAIASLVILLASMVLTLSRAGLLTL